jgi:hypothetical protein
MADVINVVLVVDTQGLVTAHSDPSQNPRKPTAVDDAFCFLIGPPLRVIKGQASAKLLFEADARDASDQQGQDDGSDADGARAAGKPAGATVLWRSRSLSGNAGQSIVIYSIAGQAPSPKAPAFGAYEKEYDAPLPDLVNGRNTDPPTFTPTKTGDYYLKGPLRKRGEQFTVSFYITAEDDGVLAAVGYFSWQAGLGTA